MRITILCVGKIKEKYFTYAIEEYSKRLSRYVKLDIIEVPDEKTPANASEADERIIKEKEGRQLLKHIIESSRVVTLEIDGRMFDSVQLSDYINEAGIEGCSHIQFVIGGSLGLSKDVLKLADCRLSFSKMTFPHQLMRVILLEQIYRSYRIINREPYHK